MQVSRVLVTLNQYPTHHEITLPERQETVKLDIK